MEAVRTGTRMAVTEKPLGTLYRVFNVISPWMCSCRQDRALPNTVMMLQAPPIAVNSALAHPCMDACSCAL
ncbi:MAG: hypothetical protein MZV70_21215 [Desulfobacterales bacterium]|nr:hypothetical protein [Desulfobacterales bacterium]